MCAGARCPGFGTIVSIAEVTIAGDDAGPAATRVAGALSTAEQRVATLADRLAGSRGSIQAAQAELNRLNIIASRDGTAAESETGARNKVRACCDSRRGLGGWLPGRSCHSDIATSSFGCS